jgi:inorganic pyrophosphatase
VLKQNLGKEFLGKKIKIEFDRPLGSKHPKFDWVYPLNYGFVPGVIAGDGDELDVYYLSGDKPLKQIEGTCIGYVHRFDDNEDKLIASDGTKFSKEEIENLLEFQEQYYKHEIILASS